VRAPTTQARITAPDSSPDVPAGQHPGSEGNRQEECLRFRHQGKAQEDPRGDRPITDGQDRDPDGGCGVDRVPLAPPGAQVPRRRQNENGERRCCTALAPTAGQQVDTDGTGSICDEWRKLERDADEQVAGIGCGGEPGHNVRQRAEDGDERGHIGQVESISRAEWHILGQAMHPSGVLVEVTPPAIDRHEDRAQEDRCHDPDRQENLLASCSRAVCTWG